MALALHRRSARHLAASRGFESLRKRPTARGVDRTQVAEDGKTATAIARARGHLAVAAALNLLTD